MRPYSVTEECGAAMLTILIVVWVLTAGLFAWIGLGARWKRRGWLLVVFLALTLISAGIVMDKLWGGCKPQALVWRTGSTELIAYDWLEGEVVWLWVRWPDEHAPRCYALAWAEETAKAIEQSEADTEESGDGQVIVEWGENIDEGEEGGPLDLDMWLPPAWFDLDDVQPPNIHAEPQRPDPPKARTKPQQQWQMGPRR